MEHLRVNYEECRTIYAPGNTVKGDLELKLSDEFDVPVITIRLVGKAHAAWSEGGRYRYPVIGNKTYINNVITRSPDGGKLNPGTHNFPFSFELPDELPTSYEHSIGHIRYYIRGTVIRPGLSRNKSIKSVFTVLSVHNLNTMKRNMKASTSAEGAIDFCFDRGLVEGVLKLDKIGYVPGESVIIQGKVDNRSRRNIDKITVKMVQLITFTGQPSTVRQESITLVKEPAQKLKRGKGLNFSGLKMPIPPVPPTETDCPILRIRYVLKLEAHLGLCSNLRVFCPFTIGTVPLDDLPSYSFTQKGDQLLQDQAEVPPLPKYQPPLPSYEEATAMEFGKKDDDDDDDDTMRIESYLPRYTFYNFEDIASSNQAYEEDIS